MLYLYYVIYYILYTYTKPKPNPAAYFGVMFVVKNVYYFILVQCAHGFIYIYKYISVLYILHIYMKKKILNFITITISLEFPNKYYF